MTVQSHVLVVDDEVLAAMALESVLRRRGFRVRAEHALTDGLGARRAAEAAAGLDPDLRVVMQRDT